MQKVSLVKPLEYKVGEAVSNGGALVTLQSMLQDLLCRSTKQCEETDCAQQRLYQFC